MLNGISPVSWLYDRSLQEKRMRKIHLSYDAAKYTWAITKISDVQYLEGRAIAYTLGYTSSQTVVSNITVTIRGKNNIKIQVGDKNIVE